VSESFSELELLQAWYLRWCDGSWEHQHRIQIETLDNPGWRVKISFEGTNVEGKTFEAIRRETSNQDWLHCWVDKNVFHGAGGPLNLGSLLKVFLDYAIDE
jgi:hypothetical protein